MPERAVHKSAGSSLAASRLRLGLIGFGRLARDFYLPALGKSSIATDIVAIADPLKASRDSAAMILPGVALFDDHRSMLATMQLDGLLIASPPSNHLAAW